MNEVSIKCSLKLYAKEAVVATIYKYSGEYTIFQDLSGDDIILTIRLKDDTQAFSEDFLSNFQKDLVDQQVRYNGVKEFGYIRDLIVEEAFKPVNKK